MSAKLKTFYASLLCSPLFFVQRGCYFLGDFFSSLFPPPPRILLAFPALICQFAAPTARKYHLVQNSPILKELGSYSGSRREVCHLVLSWRPKASLPSPGKITEAPKRRESMTLAVSDRQRRQLHAPCLS